MSSSNRLPLSSSNREPITASVTYSIILRKSFVLRRSENPEIIKCPGMEFRKTSSGENRSTLCC